MQERELIRIIDDHCFVMNQKKHIHCQKAFEIAGKLEMDISAIGDVCNSQGIKIAHCQLGCFGKTK